jgi:hypothetical protein
VRKLSTVAVAALVVLSWLLLPHALGSSVPTAEAAPPGIKTITARNLPAFACSPAEWHFVINQLDSVGQAPASIQVTWLTRQGRPVRKTAALYQTSPPSATTGGKAMAHYSTTENLDLQATAASADIYEAWSGQFVLSCPAATIAPPPPPPGSDYNPAATPELDSLILFGGGLVALGGGYAWLNRRKRRQGS